MPNGYKAALNRFEKAVRSHEFKGANHPDDWEAIDKEYERAKHALVIKLQYRAPK